MRAYKTCIGPKALFRMFLNKQKLTSQNSQGIGQKVASAAHRKKADSPGRNSREFGKVLVENLGLVLGCIAITIVATFIFVWYTALKRNL
jgi:hypothetical protein